MKKILILGAGFLQSFVIRKAREMGYYTLAVDADPNAVGFADADEYGVVDIVDEKACLRFALEHRIDGVLTAATDYGVVSAAFVAEQMGLPGLSLSCAQTVRNKHLVRRCLTEHRIDDMGQTYEVSSEAEAERLSPLLTYPVMVKPCDGAGSRGVTRADSAGQFREACLKAMAVSAVHSAEVEPFIFGEEYGAESLVADGEVHVLSIMKKWMTSPPHYAELGHAIPCGLPEAIEQKARLCAERAIKALKIGSGAVNMDMVITEDGGVYIVDVGARMGGNMIGPCVIPYGTGVDYTAAILRLAAGDPIDLTEHPHGPVATRLLAFSEGTVKALPDMKALERRFGVEIYHHLRAGMAVREYSVNGDGCGYIIARGNSQTEAVSKADRALAYLRKALF